MNYQLELEQQELTDKVGGKFAGLQWVANHNSQIMIPDYVLIDDLSSSKKIKKQLEKYQEEINEKGLYFYRSSVIGDEKGLVGMLQSGDIGYSEPLKEFLDFSTSDGSQFSTGDMEKVINFFIECGSEDLITRYAREFDNLDNYSGISSVGIMEYKTGDGFSVVQHPNIGNHFVVSGNFHSSGKYEYLVNNEGSVVHTNSNQGSNNFEIIDETDWKKIIDLSIEVDECGFIPKTHSSQKEFVFGMGQKDIYFVQQRFFLPFDYSSNRKTEDFQNYGVLDELKDNVLYLGLSGERNDNGHLYDPYELIRNIKEVNSYDSVGFKKPFGHGNGGNLRFHDSYRLILKYGKAFQQIIN
jgi:hypothetical protein